MIKYLSILWQLPQYLLGALLVGYYKALDPDSFQIEDFMSAKLIRTLKINGGISLGPFIILKTYDKAHNTVCHEYGHYRQSQLLGPFYLLIIGIPSICHAGIYKLCKKLFHKKWNYYKFYTEAWADKLGGVQR